MAGFLNSFKVLISLTRPVNVLLTVGMQYALFYIFYGQNVSEILSPVESGINHYNIHFLAILSFCAISSGFVINDFYDRETDLINRPEKSKKLSNVSDGFLLRSYWILVLIGGVAGLLFGLNSGNQHLLFLYVPACLLLWLYSKKIKALPFWGNLVVAIFCASVIFIFPFLDFYFLDSISKQGIIVSHIFWGYSIFALFVTLVREIVKDVEDREGDSKTGWTTLATQMKPMQIRKLLMILYGVYLIFGAYALFWIMTKMSLVSFLGAFLLVPPSLAAAYYIYNLHKLNAPKYASLSLKFAMILSLIFILSV